MSSAGLEMDKRDYIIHPHKFNLWLFIISLIMVFGGLTSAYVVARSMVKQPEFFELPGMLWTNTFIILFSSMTIQYSVWAVKRKEDMKAMISLFITFALGVIFLVGQWRAFGDMVLAGNHFVDPTRADDSVSYFYIFIGLHGVHIVAALLVLLVALVRTSLNNFMEGRKLLTFEITATFWHFLDLLWIYLFLFILYTQS